MCGLVQTINENGSNRVVRFGGYEKMYMEWYLYKTTAVRTCESNKGMQQKERKIASQVSNGSWSELKTTASGKADGCTQSWAISRPCIHRCTQGGTITTRMCTLFPLKNHIVVHWIEMEKLHFVFHFWLSNATSNYMHSCEHVSLCECIKRKKITWNVDGRRPTISPPGPSETETAMCADGECS